MSHPVERRLRALNWQRTMRVGKQLGKMPLYRHLAQGYGAGFLDWKSLAYRDGAVVWCDCDRTIGSYPLPRAKVGG